MVVDILRGEGFVAGHEVALAQPQILDEDRIAGKRGLAGVAQVDAPCPEVLRWMQPKRDAAMQPFGLACPNEPVCARAEPGSRARAGGFGRPSLRP